MANLPSQIMEEILSRLSVKSLCRFRCVSKTWLTLISDPQFAKLHLKQNTHQTEKPILISNSLYTIEYESDNVAEVVRLDIPDFKSPRPLAWPFILGSCNGLVLAANFHEDIHFLVNPATGHYNELPESPFNEYPKNFIYDDFIFTYGLGYDSCTDDYKIICVFCNYTKAGFPEVIASMYTLRTDSWRRIEGYPYDHVNNSPGALLNGALHWPSHRRGLDHSGFIASIDLVSEKFRDLPWPSFAQDPAKQSLGVIGGCLAMVICTSNSNYDVCVMKDYGVKESWTKFLVIGPSFNEPVFFPKSGEVLYENDNNLIFYNPNGKTSREVVIRGIPQLAPKSRVPKFVPGMIYMESLVSPEYNKRVDILDNSKIGSDVGSDQCWRNWENGLKRKRYEPFESIEEQLKGPQSSTAKNGILARAMGEDRLGCISMFGLGVGPSNTSGLQATLSEAMRMAEIERAQMIACEQRMSSVEGELHTMRNELTELKAFARVAEEELHVTRSELTELKASTRGTEEELRVARSELAELRTFVGSLMAKEQQSVACEPVSNAPLEDTQCADRE